MKFSFRKDIEGLRAIAILQVVGYHAGVPGFNGGYIGVDVFFVLSGFLITSVLLQEFEHTKTINLVEFYARRARRLLPASIAMLLIVSTCLIYACGPIEQQGFTKAAFYAACYMSNVYFAKTSVNYLDASPDSNPFLHTWSLSVEEQFYLAWPVTMLLIFRMPKRAQLAALTGLAIFFFLFSVYLTKVRQPWGFFLSPPRAWEFLIGAIAYWLVRHPLQKPLVCWLALACLLAISVCYTIRMSFPGIGALPPTICTAVLLSCQSSLVTKILGFKPVQYIGRLSYSWYLWHWPVLVSGALIWPTPSIMKRIVLVAFSICLAHFSYSLIEAPVRFNKTLIARPKRSLKLALSSTVLACILLFLWQLSIIKWVKAPEQELVVRATSDLPPHIRPETGCETWYHSSDIKECRFGESSRKVVVLLGDSIANQWASAVESIAKANGYQLLLFTKSSCPIVTQSFYLEKIKSPFTVCDDWKRKVLERLTTIRPDVTIVSMSSFYPFTPLQWQKGSQSIFTELSRSSKRLVLLRANPPANFNVANCLSRAFWHGDNPASKCSFSSYDPKSVEAFQAQQVALNSLPNAEVFDLTEVICPNQKCSPIQGEFITYRDGGHLTNTFAASLASKFQHLF